MRILAIIPARQGSKRLQGKKLLPVGVRPLVRWTIERALMTEAFVDVLVSSDDPVVVDFANQIGGLAPWLRPEHLATDSASTASVLQHALTWYESEFGGVDAVALLQPTSPFRSVETMRSAVVIPATLLTITSFTTIQPLSNGVLLTFLARFLNLQAMP